MLRVQDDDTLRHSEQVRFSTVIPDLLRKRNTLRLSHAKMQAFCRGTRLVCFSGITFRLVILEAVGR